MKVIEGIPKIYGILMKTLLAVILFIVIIVISYNFFSIPINENYDILLNQTIDYQEINAINNFFRYPENIINILSKNKELVSYKYPDKLGKLEILSLFEEIIVGDSRISNIYYISKEGEVLSYQFNEDTGINYTQKNWFKSVIESKTKINWISHKSEFTDSDVISCLQQVKDENGNFKGIVGLDIELFKLAENIKVGKNGYSMVIDARNKIIVHPDYKYLGQHITDSEFINNNKSTTNKSFTLKIGGKSYKSKVLKVDRVPSWTFVNAIPVSEITFVTLTSVLWPIFLALSFLIILTILYMRNKEAQQLNQKLKEANEKLKEYSSTIEELAVSRERNRMARDVHDTIGQTLSLLMTLLQVSIVSCKQDSKQTEGNLIKAVNVAKAGLNEIRRSISGLGPEKLEENNLFEALNSLVTDFECFGMKVELSVNRMDVNLGDNYSETIYRICQEALSNSVKHGKAKEVNIIIKFCDSNIKLFIFDNGIGCGSKKSRNGFGLKGMKQRVDNLKGNIKFGSDGEKGFNIHVELPLTNYMWRCKLNDKSCIG